MCGRSFAAGSSVPTCLLDTSFMTMIMHQDSWTVGIRCNAVNCDDQWSQITIAPVMRRPKYCWNRFCPASGTIIRMMELSWPSSKQCFLSCKYFILLIANEKFWVIFIWQMFLHPVSDFLESEFVQTWPAHILGPICCSSHVYMRARKRDLWVVTQWSELTDITVHIITCLQNPCMDKRSLHNAPWWVITLKQSC